MLYSDYNCFWFFRKEMEFMRLLYWYTRFLDKKGNSRKYHGLYEFELNLSNNMKYHYDVNTCTFSHEKHDTPLSENFWGNEPLYNINAIVGQNGACRNRR